MWSCAGLFVELEGEETKYINFTGSRGDVLGFAVVEGS